MPGKSSPQGRPQEAGQRQRAEIKLRPKIGDHDFNAKLNHVERFLRAAKGEGHDHVPRTQVQHPELERALRSSRPLESSDGLEPAEPRSEHGVMVMAPKKESREAQQAEAQQSDAQPKAASNGPLGVSLALIHCPR